MINPSLIPDKPCHLRLVETLTDLAAVDNTVEDLPLFENRLVTGHFHGKGVKTAKDEQRLASLYDRVFEVVKDGRWRTCAEIQALTGGEKESINRMLRYMDDPFVGRHHKNSRIRSGNLWEHQILARGTNAFNNWLKEQAREGRV